MKSRRVTLDFRQREVANWSAIIPVKCDRDKTASFDAPFILGVGRILVHNGGSSTST
jgi:hypothetical protein